MTYRSITSVSADYRAYSEEQRATAVRLEAEGNHEQAEVHFGSARHFADKAASTLATGENRSLTMGEATSHGGKIIAWRPKDTLYKPEQVALDASVERTQLLLDNDLDVCALALDAADTIGAENSLEKMLAHQLALAHRMCFELAQRAAKQQDPLISIKLTNASARMMDTFQRGLLTIQKLRSGNSQTMTVQHVHVHGGQAVVAGTMQAGGPQRSGRESENK